MPEGHSKIMALSKEFLLFKRRFTAGDVSCSKSLPLRGKLIPFQSGLEEHFNKFIVDLTESAKKDVLDRTKVIFQYMDINFFLSGSGRVVCPGENFRSPLIKARTDADVLMEYTFAYKANEGNDGLEIFWETETPAEFVVIRSAESLFWNRKGLRLSEGEVFEAEKVKNFDRTRLLLASGKLEVDGKIIEAPFVIPVNDRIKVIAREKNSAIALVWV